MTSQKTLIVGATGFFGRLLVDDLIRYTACRPVLASRRAIPAARFETRIADLSDSRSLERALDGMDMAICAAGPYQTMTLALADLCLERGIHYIDMADDRGFAGKLRARVAAFATPRSAICSGWSTVPALSALLTGIAAGDIREVDSIRVQMAPGNRGSRRAATVASLLYSVGQRFTVLRDGRWQMVTGWSSAREFVFPSPVGRRRGYLVDVPDHEIFPALFGARTVEFRAGSELPFLNSCLTALRWTGFRWVRWSAAFQHAAALASRIGHDCGAVGVEVSGSVSRRACIVAGSRAERIAVMPTSVIAAVLSSGVPLRSLVSYTGWLTEEQLKQECEKRGFRFVLETI